MTPHSSTSSLPIRADRATSPRDWVDAMPIVMLVRALATAFGDDRGRGRMTRVSAEAQTA